MKSFITHILVALMLIVPSVEVFAGNAQVNNVVQYGGPVTGGALTALPSNPNIILPQTSLNSQPLVTLSASVTSSTNGNYLMLTQWSTKTANGQYQVPIGKTFHMYGLYIQCSTTGMLLTLGYSFAALGVDNTASAPSAAKYFSSGAGIASLIVGSVNFAYYPFSADFPPLAFPFVETETATQNYNVVILGQEF